MFIKSLFYELQRCLQAANYTTEKSKPGCLGIDPVEASMEILQGLYLYYPNAKVTLSVETEHGQVDFAINFADSNNPLQAQAIYSEQSFLKMCNDCGVPVTPCGADIKQEPDYGLERS